MSNKKINCKHGLTRKQEIEARRLRQKIEENDKETWSKIIALRKQWLTDNQYSLFTFFLIENEHITLASAIMRITDENIIHGIYFKNEV